MKVDPIIVGTGWLLNRCNTHANQNREQRSVLELLIRYHRKKNMSVANALT